MKGFKSNVIVRARQDGQGLEIGPTRDFYHLNYLYVDWAVNCGSFRIN